MTGAVTWEPSRLGESWNLILKPGVLVVTVVRETQSRDNPSPTPYAVIIFGARMMKRFADADEAKAAALRSARRFLAEATTNLDKVEE